MQGLLITIFFCLTCFALGCIKVCGNCACHEPTTRRERQADSRAMGPPPLGFEKAFGGYSTGAPSAPPPSSRRLKDDYEH